MRYSRTRCAHSEKAQRNGWRGDVAHASGGAEAIVTASGRPRTLPGALRRRQKQAGLALQDPAKLLGSDRQQSDGPGAFAVRLASGAVARRIVLASSSGVDDQRARETQVQPSHGASRDSLSGSSSVQAGEGVDSAQSLQSTILGSYHKSSLYSSQPKSEGTRNQNSHSNGCVTASSDF